MSKFDDDYDYFEENFDEGLKQSSKSYSGGDSTRFPTIYTYKPGTYKFRLYPENYKGVPRWIRYMDFHQLHHFSKKVITKEKYGDPEINKIIEKAEEAGLEGKKNGAWKHKKSNEAVMLVYLISAPKDYQKYEGQAVAMVLQWQQIKAWKSFQDEFDAEDMGCSYKKFIDPRRESPALKMTVSTEMKGKSKQVHVNMSATNNTFELPKLSEALPEGIEFIGLDDLHVKESYKLTPELLAEFSSYIDTEVSKIKEYQSQNQYSPSETDGMGGGYKPSTHNENTLDDDEDEEGIPWEEDQQQQA